MRAVNWKESGGVFRRGEPNAADREILILMNLSGDRARRLVAADGSLPRWFGSPVLEAFGACRVSRSPAVVAKHGLSAGRRAAALVFNIGQVEAFLALLPRRACELIALYQWPALEALSPAKRWIYRRLLRRSSVIVTYSRASIDYLEALFPDRPVQWIGHFTDTDFFDPACCPEPPEDFLLCPGDHKRIEPVVAAIAGALQTPVVRFAADPRVADYYDRNPSPWIRCLSRIPHADVRRLYATAAQVINVVDDREWPVGITTFCEALAMNRPTITSGGHSCSGYSFEDGFRPYLTVSDCEDADEWIAAVRRVREAPPQLAAQRSARDLALRLCSLDAMAAGWRSARDRLSPAAAAGLA